MVRSLPDHAKAFLSTLHAQSRGRPPNDEPFTIKFEPDLVTKLTFGQTALPEQRKKFCEKERMETEKPSVSQGETSEAVWACCESPESEAFGKV